MSFGKVVSFGNISVAIEAQGERCEGIAAYATKCLTPGDASTVTITLRAIEDNDAPPHARFHLKGDTESFAAPSAGLLLEQLVRRITFHLIDKNSSGLTMHSAMVSRDGAALLFPGVSGAGKSTLTTHLVRLGYALATDELSMLPERLTGSSTESDEVRVFGLPRPLHLKPNSMFMLRDVPASPFIERFEDGAFVHVEAIGGTVQAHPRTLAAIVFPRYDKAEQSFERLSGATATRELMSSLVNARNLQGHGFSAMAAIARKVPAFSLTYHDFAFAEEHLNPLVTAFRAKSGRVAPLS